MLRTLFGLTGAVLLSTAWCPSATGRQTATPMQPHPLVIHTDSVRYTMAGGIGASWHAIQAELPAYSHETYAWPSRDIAPRGSAVGGNPPLEFKEAWDDLFREADWLGMDWIRVEVSRRMYEPERRTFDWENDEMRTLYRILDWCRERRVDVFLTEMWGAVEWNAFPDVHPLMSAPKSVEDFAYGLGELVEHLTVRRGYDTIRWLVVANEPGYDWAWWIGPDGHQHSITPALAAVRTELDRRGIAVQLSGPDWTNPPAPTSPDVPQALDFIPWLGAFDIHSYDAPDAELEDVWKAWVALGRLHNKPVFLSEMGNMALGWRGADPGPRSFAAALSNAEKVLRGLRAGLHAFNRWSFVNRGDLDGQWQLVRTFDIESQSYLPRVVREPIAGPAFGILTRYVKKHSDVLLVDGLDDLPEGCFLGAVRGPDGGITVLAANLSDTILPLALKQSGGEAGVGAFYRYRVTEPVTPDAALKLVPERIEGWTGEGWLVEELPPRSITALSQVRLGPEDPGVR